MIKLGLTGGIGSGKSLVAQLIRQMGYPVYNSDIESKRLCNTNTQLKQKLMAAFGTNIYNAQGELDRKHFSDLIFNNKEKLQKANNIIHPAVISDFERWAATQNSPIVLVESAILFESLLNEKVDKIIWVSAPVELRIARVMLRENMQRSEVESRMKHQISEEKIIDQADYIILNDEKQLLIPQVESLLEEELMP